MGIYSVCMNIEGESWEDVRDRITVAGHILGNPSIYELGQPDRDGANEAHRLWVESQGKRRWEDTIFNVAADSSPKRKRKPMTEEQRGSAVLRIAHAREVKRQKREALRHALAPSAGGSRPTLER